MDTTDLRVYALSTIVMFVTLTEIEVILKISLLALTIAYTSYKWVYFYKKKKHENK
jgi:hypothetical protein